MSRNTNNLRAILNSFYEAAFTETEEDGKLDNSLDEAIASVLALLPEKQPQVPGNKEPYINRGYIEGEVNGHNKAIDQTRRNLIGEQPGDSKSPRGGSKPLSNHVMPEAPPSGEER